MEDIRDCKGHLVCKAEPIDGLIESSYKKQTTRTLLPIGGVFIIERDGVRTTITRKNQKEFYVDSNTYNA